MLFQRINRSDPEKIFLVARNSYTTASLSNGQAVMWDYTVDKDGVGVSIAVAAKAKHGGFTAAGIAAETIAAGAYGLIQVYGYHSAARVRAFTAPATNLYGAVVATGTPLGLLSAAFCLEGVGVVSGVSVSSTIDRVLYPCAFSLGAATGGYTTTTGAVFIKAL